LLCEAGETVVSNISLKYSIDRIKKLGLGVNQAEDTAEIDALLEFCYLSFSKGTL
jgi:hypothetical protein